MSDAKNLYCKTCKRQHVILRPQAQRHRSGATWGDAIESLLGVAVLALMCAALWLWMAIAAASQL